MRCGDAGRHSGRPLRLDAAAGAQRWQRWAVPLGEFSMSNEMQHLADILRRAEMARKEPVPEEPAPRVCSICGGAGYLRYDVPMDDPRFGQLVICECMRQELDERRQRTLLARSQLDQVPDYTFDRWKAKEGGKRAPGSPDHAFDLARKYAADPGGNGRPWLFLYGPTGTGKTHLAAAVGHERIARGQPAMFAVVPVLLRKLRKTFNPENGDSFDEMFDALLDTPLLILDDLGTQSATPWAAEQLFQLFNHR